MTEPGDIIETGGKVPLRFVVLAEGLDFHDSNRDMALYCSARDDSIVVKESRFMELNDATVMEMSKQQIESEVNHKTAQVADEARQAYLNGIDNAEVL